MPLTTRFLTIDPGLDEVGWALWDLDNLGGRTMLLQDAPKRLMKSGTWRTNAKHPTEQRLDVLATVMHGFLAVNNPDTVAIERPAYTGTYRRHAAKETGAGFMGGTMGACHLATGALYAAARAGGRRVFFVPAAGSSKADRHKLVYVLWPEKQTRGASSADERDAISIGLTILTDARRRWQNLPA